MAQPAAICLLSFNKKKQHETNTNKAARVHRSGAAVSKPILSTKMLNEISPLSPLSTEGGELPTGHLVLITFTYICSGAELPDREWTLFLEMLEVKVSVSQRLLVTLLDS